MNRRNALKSMFQIAKVSTVVAATSVIPSETPEPAVKHIDAFEGITIRKLTSLYDFSGFWDAGDVFFERLSEPGLFWRVQGEFRPDKMFGFNENIYDNKLLGPLEQYYTVEEVTIRDTPEFDHWVKENFNLGG